WAGTVLAVEALCDCVPFTTRREAKKNVVSAVGKVAERLGNTVAVCKKCYIHPGVIETYMRGTLHQPASATISCKEKMFVSMLKKWSTPKPKLTLEQALVKSVKAARKK